MATRRMSRRSGGSFRRGSRPRYQWARFTEDAAGGVSLSTSGGVPFDLLSEYRTAAGLAMGVFAPTIERVRMTLSAEVTVAAGGESLVSYMGIIKVTGLSGAEVPRPSSNPHADWMYWRQLTLDGAVGSRIDLRDDTEIDVRSRRKLDELEDTLWLVFEQTSTGTLEGNFGVSTLMRLGRR